MPTNISISWYHGIASSTPLLMINSGVVARSSPNKGRVLDAGIRGLDQRLADAAVGRLVLAGARDARLAANVPYRSWCPHRGTARRRREHVGLPDQIRGLIVARTMAVVGTNRWVSLVAGSIALRIEFIKH
jgi:hypothetical protein